MAKTHSAQSALRVAMLAATCGIVALPASAQPYGAYARPYNPYDNRTPYSGGPTETVNVIAPRFRADSTPLNGPLEKVSLSSTVPYGDLNLATWQGESTLRWRVWRTAGEVCGRLAAAYPVYELSSAPRCLETAYENALVRANGAITNARLGYWYGY